MSYQSANDALIQQTGNEDIIEIKKVNDNRKKGWLLLALLLLVGIVLVLVLLDTADDDASAQQLLKYTSSNPDAVCNDGSPSIYYVREGSADKFLVYIEGGYLYCWDEATCADRAENNPELMTSYTADLVKTPTGLLSANCTMNPDWCNATLGYVFYCSSDYFQGTISAEESGLGYAFQGAEILRSTLEDLLTKHGLAQATDILLVGKGGGGVALLMKADDIVDQIQAGLDDASSYIRAFVDTGLLIDREPYDPAFSDCVNVSSSAECTLAAGVANGVELWQPDYPQACVDAGLTYECFFGVNTIGSTQTKLLLSGFQYDYAQLDTEGCDLHAGLDDTNKTDWAEAGAQVWLEEDILPLVETGFFPNCYNHEFVDQDRWLDTTINGESLLDVMHDWDSDGLGLRYDDVWTINENPTCP